MRISPFGIFGARFELNQVADWAMQVTELTHPNLICQQTNALFAMRIAHAIQPGCDRKDLYQHIRQWAIDMTVEPALLDIAGYHRQGCQRAASWLYPPARLGVDRFSECPVSATPCAKPQRKCRRYHHARR